MPATNLTKAEVISTLPIPTDLLLFSKKISNVSYPLQYKENIFSAIGLNLLVTNQPKATGIFAGVMLFLLARSIAMLSVIYMKLSREYIVSNAMAV